MTTGLIIAVVLLLIWTIVLTIRLKNVYNKVIGMDTYLVGQEFQIVNKLQKIVEGKVDDVKRSVLKLYEKEQEAINILKEYYSTDFKEKCLNLAIKICAGSNRDALIMAGNIEEYLLAKNDICEPEKEEGKNVDVDVWKRFQEDAKKRGEEKERVRRYMQGTDWERHVEKAEYPETQATTESPTERFCKQHDIKVGDKIDINRLPVTTQKKIRECSDAQEVEILVIDTHWGVAGISFKGRGVIGREMVIPINFIKPKDYNYFAGDDCNTTPSESDFERFCKSKDIHIGKKISVNNLSEHSKRMVSSLSQVRKVEVSSIEHTSELIRITFITNNGKAHSIPLAIQGFNF